MTVFCLDFAVRSSLLQQLKISLAQLKRTTHRYYMQSLSVMTLSLRANPTSMLLNTCKKACLPFYFKELLHRLPLISSRAEFLISCNFWQGSGLSDGDWVTLGAHEVEDLETAVAHLRKAYPESAIGLWGRSMGAVTALMYSQRDPSIAGVVSPRFLPLRLWCLV